MLYIYNLSIIISIIYKIIIVIKLRLIFWLFIIGLIIFNNSKQNKYSNIFFFNIILYTSKKNYNNYFIFYIFNYLFIKKNFK